MDDDVKPQESAADLRRYLTVVWKRRWSVAAVCLLTVVSAVVFTSMQVPVFQAAATVWIEPEPPRVLSAPELVPTSGTEDYYATQYKIIESRPVVEGAIQRFKLKERLPALGRAADSYLMFLGGLSVEPVKNTRLVLVKFESPDPVLAADLANAVASEYVKYNLELKHKIAQDAFVWLNEQLGGLRKQTQQSSKALQAYQTQADLLGTQEQRQVAQQKIVDFNRAYLDAQEKRLTIESRLRELSRVAQDPRAIDTVFTEDSLIQKLKTEASDLQIERSKIAQISKEKHPDLLQIDAQIRQVRLRLQQEVQRMVRTLETELKVAKAREETLLANVNELRKDARRLYEKEAHAVSLQREKDSGEELQASVLKRFKEAGMASALEANNVRVVEAATPPLFPIKPRKRLIWTLSVVLGLSLGVGMAFLADSLDNKVRSAKDVERAVGLPVLGVVPVFQVRRYR